MSDFQAKVLVNATLTYDTERLILDNKPPGPVQGDLGSLKFEFSPKDQDLGINLNDSQSL